MTLNFFGAFYVVLTVTWWWWAIRRERQFRSGYLKALDHVEDESRLRGGYRDFAERDVHDVIRKLRREMKR